ncbi:hypothetical protein CASFOL_020966 [Castilleja foliolosa]|uniref:Uncharacterized protein n=1 Tax=Castilleja foliolosa TaxID=1961234 RepID=A0ABD3D3P7_9LAMI
MLEKTAAGWAAATAEIGLEETMLQLGLGGRVGPESYPERPDQPACTESRKNEQRNVNGWDDDLMQYSTMDKWNLHNRSNLKRARRMDAMFKVMVLKWTLKWNKTKRRGF